MSTRWRRPVDGTLQPNVYIPLVLIYPFVVFRVNVPSWNFAANHLRWLVGGRPLPPLVFWAPALVVGAALLLPPVYLVVRALGGGSELWELLFRERVAEVLGRTLLLVVSVTAASIVLALPLAWLTVRTDLPFRRVWTVLATLPLVVPSYVAGFIVVVALGPRGMLQGVLEDLFGIQRLPDIQGFPGAMLTLTFLSYPYVLITVRAALLRLDPALEESARGLGLGPWGTFFRVVCQLLRPALAAGGLLTGLYTLSDFGAVSLLQYETFTWAIFIQYESALDRTLGAGLSLVLAVLALGWVGLELVSRGRGRYFSTSAAPSRPPALVRLGRWRWPALLLCFAVVAVSLMLPMSILGYWVARGAAAGESMDVVWEAAGNSLYISALAALATVSAAAPLAALSVRFPGLLSGLLERLSYVGFALPGIGIALALVFFAANYALPLYQTTGILLLAYVVLFLSPALGAVRASLLQISPRIEEAARGLGRGPVRAFSSVTLPVARPGILAGAALVFLLTMKELPATLILSPTGFNTLATSIWSAASEAFFARAAISSLLLIALSAVPLAVIMLRERR